MLFVNLATRLVGLAVVAMLAVGYYTAVKVGLDSRAGTRPCVASPSPVVVHVPAGDVAYARSAGWPRVMFRGDPVGWAPALDHSPTAARVRARTARFCPSRRFRLEAR